MKRIVRKQKKGMQVNAVSGNNSSKQNEFRKMFEREGANERAVRAHEQIIEALNEIKDKLGRITSKRATNKKEIGEIYSKVVETLKKTQYKSMYISKHAANKEEVERTYSEVINALKDIKNILRGME